MKAVYVIEIDTDSRQPENPGGVRVDVWELPEGIPGGVLYRGTGITEQGEPGATPYRAIWLAAIRLVERLAERARAVAPAGEGSSL